ncbi:hypothetical protein HYW83_02420 [Candidatus Peregrinibacteria bacterium]|nr:hypothetical protein [Candidatus Peregrinibacteria bacterium]
MKKILMVLGFLLVLGTACSSQNIEVVSPFNHPLFITKDDLSSFKLAEYHFVSNEEISRKEGELFASTTRIYPSKDLLNKNFQDPASYIHLDATEFSSEDSAKARFQNFYKKVAKLGPTDQIYTENYNNLGEENILTTISLTLSSEYSASLTSRYKNYIININAVSLKSLNNAEEQAAAITELILERIKIIN